MTQKSAKQEGHCQHLKTFNKLGVSKLGGVRWTF